MSRSALAETDYSKVDAKHGYFRTSDGVPCTTSKPARVWPMGLRKIRGQWTVTHEHHSIPAG